MIEAYIANKRKYYEGEQTGEYLKLPAAEEDVKALLMSIGVDGVLYREISILYYMSDVEGLDRILGGHESIDELNYLATVLSGMDSREIYKFEATLEYGEHTSSVKELINLALNQDCYDLNPDVAGDEELGVYNAGLFGAVSVPETLEHYIDYESYGRDIASNENGKHTANGYIRKNTTDIGERYCGKDDIPKACRIFSYPDLPDKMRIRQQLEMYGNMTDPAKAGRQHARTREAR